jgi:hypothetical protein
MKFDIEWLQGSDKDQRLDVFYCEGYDHSPVCIVKGNTVEVLISCDGEMKAVLTKDNGDEVYITDFWGLLHNDIKTDKALMEINNKIEWHLNPWFDAYDITSNYDPDIGHESYDNLDIVEGNLDDIIEKVKLYIIEKERVSVQ